MVDRVGADVTGDDDWRGAPHWAVSGSCTVRSAIAATATPTVAGSEVLDEPDPGARYAPTGVATRGPLSLRVRAGRKVKDGSAALAGGHDPVVELSVLPQVTMNRASDLLSQPHGPSVRALGAPVCSARDTAARDSRCRRRCRAGTPGSTHPSIRSPRGR